MQTLSLIPECMIQVSTKEDGNISSYEDLASLSSFRKDKTPYLPEHRHGTDVVVITKDNVSAPPIAGDIIVTSLSDVVIAQKFADCIPFVCIDRKKKAFVFSHLGWKGLVIGGVQVSVLALQAHIGSLLSDLWVWIGPCIQKESYGFEAIPIQASLPNWDDMIMMQQEGEQCRWQVNLPGFVVQECARIGIDPAQIINDGRDTYTMPDIFFSHRRAIEKNEDKGSFVVTVTL